MATEKPAYRIELFATSHLPHIQCEIITPDGFSFILDRAQHPHLYECIAIADGVTMEAALNKAMQNIGSFMFQLARGFCLNRVGDVETKEPDDKEVVMGINNHNLVLPPWIKLSENC